MGRLSARLSTTPTAPFLRRWDQLLKAVCSEAAEEGGEDEAPPDPEILANKFRSLVLERYIERAPPCSLPPPAQQVRPLRHGLWPHFSIFWRRPQCALWFACVAQYIVWDGLAS